jgi:phage repressor protein C with HTH and peptisase S24 domain
MLRHADIWAAIDRLARERGLTASGLARRAGLDPTTFNKSKRITREGKPRWPSTESIAKVLDATGATVTEFTALLSQDPADVKPCSLPLVSSAEVLSKRLNGELQAHLDDAGAIAFPDAADDAFAVEMSDDRLAPAYRRGDVLIVSAAAPIRRGDRVLARMRDGESIAAEVKRHSGRGVALRRLNGADEVISLEMSEFSWIVRVLWASQ